VLAVEGTDLVLADQLDREMAVVEARRSERLERGPAELLRGVDELDLDQVR
jgi:hypothetical protein